MEKYADINVSELDGGCDITLTALDGMMFEDGSTTMTLHLRSDHGPRIGERVMVGRTLVKVLEKRYDQDGRLMLLDEDTKAWFAWEGR